MKVVVCGSYGDMEGFLNILERCRRNYGTRNVFPTNDHIRRSRPCIEAHHGSGEETPETIAVRAELMKTYFDEIDASDLVLIANEKKGSEYYGVGTVIELGYAFAKDKKIHFTRSPTDSNILSLRRTNPAQFVQ